MNTIKYASSTHHHGDRMNMLGDQVPTHSQQLYVHPRHSLRAAAEIKVAFKLHTNFQLPMPQRVLC